MGSSRTFVSETGAWVSVSRDLDDTFYDLNNTNTIWTNRDSRGSRRHRDVSCRMPSERSPDNTIYCPSRCYKEPSKKSNTLDLTEYMPIRKSSRCRSPRAVDRTEELPRTKCDLSPCGSLTSYDGDISLRSPGLLSSKNLDLDARIILAISRPKFHPKKTLLDKFRSFKNALRNK